jgi:hypothetical protein
MKTLRTLTLLSILFVATPLLAQQDAAESGWFELRPPETRLFVHLPVEPKYQQRTMTPEKGTEIIQHQYMATLGEDKHTAYLFNYHDLAEEPIGNAQIRKVLDDTVTGMIARIGGKVKVHNSISLLRNPGREIVFDFADRDENKYVFHSRVYLRESRMYQLNVVSKEANYSQEEAVKFFESLKLKVKANPPAEEADETESATDQSGG